MCLLQLDGDSSRMSIISCWTDFSSMKVSAKVTKTSSSGCYGTRKKRRSVVSRNGKLRFAKWTSVMEVSVKLCEYVVDSVHK